MRVRRGTASDAPAASAVLADAFSDYPWTKWTVDKHRHSARVEGLQRLVIDRVALPYGELWVACDNRGDVMSAAVWMLPGSAVPAEVLSDMAPEQAQLEGARSRGVGESRGVRRRAPAHGPSLLPRHGRDAARLPGPGIRRGSARTGARSRGAEPTTTVFLETSTRSNLDFYAKLGFVVTAEIDVPDGGPHVWAMTRLSRPL